MGGGRSLDGVADGWQTYTPHTHTHTQHSPPQPHTQTHSGIHTHTHPTLHSFNALRSIVSSHGTDITPFMRQFIYSHQKSVFPNKGDPFLVTIYTYKGKVSLSCLTFFRYDLFYIFIFYLKNLLFQSSVQCAAVCLSGNDNPHIPLYKFKEEYNVVLCA